MKIRGVVCVVDCEFCAANGLVPDHRAQAHGVDGAQERCPMCRGRTTVRRTVPFDDLMVAVLDTPVPLAATDKDVPGSDSA